MAVDPQAKTGEDIAVRSGMLGKSKFWNELMHDVYGPRKGGAICFVDAENSRKGVAKTSCAVAFARKLADAFGYGFEIDDCVLSGAEYLSSYREHPGEEQPSVIVLDEFVGAGSGDKRRAMSTQNVNFGRAWQLLRKKRVVTLAVLPDWNAADKRLKKLADYRLWCRERPLGCFQPYKVTVPFHSSGGAKISLKGLTYRPNATTDRIHFPDMDRNDDPYYAALTEKKEELIKSETWDADELRDDSDEDGQEQPDPDEIKRLEKIKTAIKAYKPWDDGSGLSQEQVADLVDYSSSWVGDTIREWERGEHRDLVEAPQTADT